MPRRVFRIGWIPAVAAMAAIALTVALGNWQMRRADRKIAMQAEMKAAAEIVPLAPASWVSPKSLIRRRFVVSGTWMPEAAIYLDNRPYRGRAGFYVLMPLRVGFGEEPASSTAPVLIVNRGWLPRDPADRMRIAGYRTPSGKVTIEANALADEPRLFELGSATPGRLGGIWQNFDFENFRAASRLAPVPLMFRQAPGPGERAGDSPDGLVRDWPDQGEALQAQIDRHHGYAFQWYGLAVLTTFLTLFYACRNVRK